MIRADGNGGWWAAGEVCLTELPRAFIVPGDGCYADHPNGAFACMRNTGHTGRHATMTLWEAPTQPATGRVLAVWR